MPIRNEKRPHLEDLEGTFNLRIDKQYQFVIYKKKNGSRHRA